MIIHHAICLKFFLMKSQGNSLVVQWLGLGIFTAGAQVKNKIRKLAMIYGKISMIY